MNVAIAYIVIKHCRRINDWMGQTGIVVSNKIAGVILLALSIKMFADNWKTIFE
ncbi:MarC family protein [Capnocytophaga gingivalis]